MRLINGAHHVGGDFRYPVAARNAVTYMNDLNLVILQNNCFELSIGFFHVANGLKDGRNGRRDGSLNRGHTRDGGDDWRSRPD